MKSSTTIILLLVVAAIGAYVYFVEQETPVAGITTTEPPLQFATERAATVTITTAGETTTLQRKTGLWFLISPVNDRADQDACDEFLAALNEIEIRETFNAAELGPNALDSASTGLTETEAAAVTVFSDSGTVLASVVVGAPGALDDTCYLRFPDRREFPAVYLASGNLSAFANRPLTSLRAPRVFPLAASDVGRLLLRDGESEFEIYRETANSRWSLGRPLPTRADQEAVDQLVENICALEVAAFVDSADERAADLANQRGITLWGFEPETGLVLSAEVSPGYGLDLSAATSGEENAVVVGRVSDRSAVFELPAGALALAAASPLDLRDRKLGLIPAEEIRGILIRPKTGQEVLLSNNGRNWLSLRKGDWEAADQQRVNAFLRAVNKETILDFAAPAADGLEPFDLAPPSILVAMTTSRKAADPTPLEQPGAEAPIELEDPDALNFFLSLGRVIPGETSRAEPPEAPETAPADTPESAPPPEPSDEKLYARFGSEPYVVSLDPTFLNFLPSDPIKWKNRSLLSYNIISFRGMTITRRATGETPASETRLGFDPLTGKWTASVGEDDLTDKIDAASLTAYVEALGTLRARDWLAGAGDGYRALESPTITIKIELGDLSADGSREELRSTSLNFAPALESDGKVLSYHYGRIDDSIDVFLIDNADLEAVLTPSIQ